MSDITAGELHNADELGQYKSLSSTAVMALCLGLSSPLILASSVLTILALAGIAVAILALVRISASGGALTGAGLAKAGLALSVLSLFVPVSKDFVRDAMAQEQARQVAESWLSSIVAGEGEVAARLVLPRTLYEMTVRPSAPGASSAPSYTPADGIASFLNDRQVKQLASLDSSDSFAFEPSRTEHIWNPRTPQVLCYFSFKSEGQDERICSILLERHGTPAGSKLWLVKQWNVLPADDA